MRRKGTVSFRLKRSAARSLPRCSPVPISPMPFRLYLSVCAEAQSFSLISTAALPKAGPGTQFRNRRKIPSFTTAHPMQKGPEPSFRALHISFCGAGEAPQSIPAASTGAAPFYILLTLPRSTSRTGRITRGSGSGCCRSCRRIMSVARVPFSSASW